MHISEQKSLLEMIEHQDFSEMNAAFAAQKGLDPLAVKALEKELKRYFFLIRLNRSQYGISGVLDEYWHAAILRTQFYHDLCEAVFGQYLHHQPDGGGDGEGVDMRYVRFLVDYRLYFGEPPPFHIWPLSQELFAPQPVFSRGPQCIAPCFWAA
ncbi:hypothetical protein [Brevundimonas sp.]|uniref:hypothetical protein n=1 Tax=Brevundimonas sp. TaxID=1871086 RepID=UPI002FC7712F